MLKLSIYSLWTEDLKPIQWGVMFPWQLCDNFLLYFETCTCTWWAFFLKYEFLPPILKPPKNAGKKNVQTVFHLNTTSADCKEVAARRACGWARECLVWLEPAIQLETCTWSAVNLKKKTADLDGSQLEPTIWSQDTGQRIPCFDRCQLTITWMSNIKDVRCKLGGQLEYGRHVGLLSLLIIK